MAQIKSIRFDKSGRNDGCTCDKCGQYIMNIWTVQYSDGVTLHYGIDCFSKIYKSGKLTRSGEKLIRATLKSIEYYSEQLEVWKALTEQEAEEKGLLGTLKVTDWNDSYWAGKTFEEYKDWMVNEFFPARLAHCQKDIDRFAKVNFTR